MSERVGPRAVVRAGGNGDREESLSLTVYLPAKRHATLRLAGRFDAVTAPAVRGEIDALTADGRVQLVVDLSRVGFMDSAALAVLVRARRENRQRAGDVVLIGPDSPEALRVFRLTQFDQVFRIVPARATED